MTSDIERITKANKAAWDASSDFHMQGDEWETLVSAAGKKEFSVLDEVLTQSLKEIGIDGRRAVQIGCNNGRELLSLASLGAVPALGIDQSSGFLKQARILAKASGLTPQFLETDIYDLPEDMGSFDLVLITIGVLNWMPDIDLFFEIVAGLMNKNSTLVIYDTHPFMEVFDPRAKKTFEPSFSYFKGEPKEVTQSITYDGLDHGTGETGYWFIHPLGSIVTSCAAAGLRIEKLTEYAHTIREPEYDIYSNQDAQIPMSYKLIAKR